MTSGTEHFLGNCQHLGVNGSVLVSGCLYSMPQTSVNSKTEETKRIFNLSVPWCHADVRARNILHFLTRSGIVQDNTSLKSIKSLNVRMFGMKN